MRLEGEVAGVEELHIGAWNVTPECLRARRQEERIMPAPHRQERWLVAAEIRLEGRIECDVALVVTEQVELHFCGPGPGQVKIIERVSVRRYCRRVGHAVGVLPDRGLGRQERPQGVTIGL